MFPMIPPNLQDFLQNCKTQSLSFESVESQLVKAGWSPAYIEEARKWYLPISPNSKSKSPLFFIPILIILLLLGTAVLGAYNIIPFPNTELFIKGRMAIIGLPFMPKTPEYVLASSALAHQKVKQVRLDLTMNFSSKNLVSIFGSENVALRLKGPIDISNLNSPKFSFNITLGRDYDFDVQIENKVLYVKVNQFSATPLAPLGVDENVLSSFFNKWIAYDLSSAMKDDNKTKKTDDTVQLDESQKEELKKLTYEKILPIITMTQEKINDNSAYKIHLDIDGKMLDEIENIINKNVPTAKQPKTKLSESIRKIYLDTWVDPKTYLAMKEAINVDYIIKSQTSSGSLFTVNKLDENGKFSINGTFSDYNKPVEIEIPNNPLKPEDVMLKIMQSSKLYKSQLNSQQSELNYSNQSYQPSHTY